jgi:hypothetical protein
MSLYLIKYHDMKAYGEWRYSNTINDFGTSWSGKLHVPAVLLPGAQSPVHIG